MAALCEAGSRKLNYLAYLSCGCTAPEERINAWRCTQNCRPAPIANHNPANQEGGAQGGSHYGQGTPWAAHHQQIFLQALILPINNASRQSRWGGGRIVVVLCFNINLAALDNQHKECGRCARSRRQATKPQQAPPTQRAQCNSPDTPKAPRQRHQSSTPNLALLFVLTQKPYLCMAQGPTSGGPATTSRPS